ncbi:MAG: histidine kinase [Bacteroidota bacterium]
MNRLKISWDKSFTDWRYRLLLHVMFWFFILFYWTQESVVLLIKWEQHYSVTLIGICLALFLFYPLVYAIVPLFQKRKWLPAIGLLAVYYIIAVTLRAYNIELIMSWYNLKKSWVVGQDFFKRLYAHEFAPLNLLKIFFSSIPSLLEIIYLPLTVKFIRYAYRFNLKQAWLAKENAQLQLSTLKAQVNPHFFFNTLNNLQSFIVQNEREKSVDLLIKLGDFMRSSLYDCDADLITVKQEADLLTNYIAIERVRFDEQATINLNFLNDDPEYKIPPFIFLPFVENAFKHGGSVPAEDVLISIDLKNTVEKITLTTKNRYGGQASKGGIGLQNVRKRLSYYFNENYKLSIENTGDIYSVILEICKP